MMALACAVHGGRALATDGLEPIGVSLQANARGGADVAVGDTALSQIENPATISWLERRFDMSGLFGIPIATWTGPLETEESHTRFIPLGNAAAVFPLDKRTTLGLSLHSKAGLGTSYHMRHLLMPLLNRDVGGDMKCVDLQANVSHKVTERLSVGGGVRMDVAQAAFSMALGPIDMDFGKGRSYGGGFQLGAMYKVRDDVTLGVSYRSPTWGTDLEGGRGKATVLGIVPIGLGGISIADFQLPQRVAGGIAWEATKKLKLVGEVRWLNYRNSTIDVVKIQTHGWLDMIYPLPLGYRNQWAVMGGAEYRLSPRWVVSGGYHYATPPVSGGNLLPMGSTISDHHVTTGIRYEREKWYVGLGYVLAFPADIHGSGWSRIPLGMDYGFSRIRQTQHMIGVGFGVHW